MYSTVVLSSPWATACVAGALAACLAFVLAALDARWQRRRASNGRMTSYLGRAPARSHIGSPPVVRRVGRALREVLTWPLRARLRAATRRRLVDLVPVLLEVLGNALRAGSTLPEALSHAAEEVPSPLGELVSSAYAAYHVGRPLDEVLVDIQQRIALPIMDLAVSAITINRVVGGSIAPLLTDAAELVREDLRLQKDLHVATAQMRFSAQLIGLLPVLLLIVQAVINPASVAPFFESPLGVVMLLAVGVLDAVGYVLVVRASRVSF